MTYLKLSLGIFLALSASRFIPHPPNFTSLIALAFYIPAIFGRKYVLSTAICLSITDLIIGLHSTILFTWTSVILIGLVSEYFKRSLMFRLSGALIGATMFFIISNFGVWILGSYGYSLKGFLDCYFLAIPFFGYTILSTFLFSVCIEFVYGLMVEKNRSFL